LKGSSLNHGALLRWAARQRAQQNLLKSLRLYSAGDLLASSTAPMHPDHPAEASSRPPPPALVLDTNVLLDWLVFHDPSTAALEHAIHSGERQWIATQAMRDEMEQVLTREHLLSRQTDPGLAMSTWDRWARMVEPPATATPSTMRCTDPDDQKFIDLALHLGADLLSRDRAVLQLARAGRGFGIQIMTAAAWAAAATPPGNRAVSG
jgi:predicted nucleic acid-binding protein